MNRMTKNLNRFPKFTSCLAVFLVATVISLITVFANSASAFEPRGSYVLTVKSCTDWTCTPNGGVDCPGPSWKPPGC
jgi:hypothetical protein